MKESFVNQDLYTYFLEGSDSGWLDTDATKLVEDPMAKQSEVW